MKKFHYSFTPNGTLKIWLSGSKEWPELAANIEPSFAQNELLHTQGAGEVPVLQSELKTGDLPGIIECLLYYQQYYNLN
jgi:hypothetical protein